VKAIHSTLKHAYTPYDGWRSISISLYMTLVGYGVLVAIPVISAARVQLLGFSEVEVGRVASADLGGLAAGAALASFFMANSNRRVLALIGAVLAILANALCTRYTHYEQVFYLRILAGIGSGIYTSVAVANLGATAKPARAYNLMLFAFAFSQAFELQVLPLLSMNGIYYVFMGGFIAGLLALQWIPVLADDKRLDVELDVEESDGRHHPEHRHVPSYITWLCLVAIFLTYINIGGYWTYIELAAHDAAIADELISKLLVWGSLCSVVGCLLATLISNRFGLARPLLAALLAMTTTVGMLYEGIDTPKLIISMLSFNLLWIFIDVYQMAFVANADHSGAFASLIPCAQGLGQIVGPNVAASMLGHSLGYGNVFLMCALFALLGVLTYLAVYLKLRCIIPALADAP
jgi:predicted MFS family arabinose efflux permease